MRPQPRQPWRVKVVSDAETKRKLSPAAHDEPLVAKDMGFDSCLMTHFDAAEFSRILGLPTNLRPVLLCPLGYADDKPLPKWRYSVDELLIP